MKKNKNILFKTLTVFTVLVLIFSLCAISVSATDTDALTEEKDGEVINGADNTEKRSEEENFFSALFSALKDRAAEIFSVLTFICSLVLAYAYKKGLFPLIKGALSSLNGSVNRIKENAENELEKNQAVSTEVREKLSDFEKLITATGDKLALIEEKLGESENRQDREMKTIISAQIDMLYDVFMSSSLPQYQKDAIGQRVVKMKETLGENETT